MDLVVQGFREGFWPGADSGMLHDLPDSLDNQWTNEAGDEATLVFLQAQWVTEISLGRFSASFGPRLLPGMIAQPVFAVPKPGSAKFRLVNDHTAGNCHDPCTATAHRHPTTTHGPFPQCMDLFQSWDQVHSHRSHDFPSCIYSFLGNLVPLV